jgi:hypothetical protein
MPAFASETATKDKMTGKASNGILNDVRNVSISENDGLTVTPIDSSNPIKKGEYITIGYQIKNSSETEQSVRWSIASSPFEVSDIKIDKLSLAVIADEGIIILKSGSKIKVEFLFQVPLNFESKNTSIKIDFYPYAENTTGPKYEPIEDINPYPEGSWPWYEEIMKDRGIYFA